VKLLGLSWVSAFAALFLAITGLAAELDRPDLQTMLWPTLSGFLVGVLYLGEGATRRNVLHYGLGTWLALTSAAALLLGMPGLFWVLSIAGGGGFAVAAVLESRRLAPTAAPWAARQLPESSWPTYQFCHDGPDGAEPGERWVHGTAAAVELPVTGSADARACG
jgi:hypothetical protein